MESFETADFTPKSLTVTDAERLLRAGTLKASELVQLLLDRIDATEPELHAYQQVDRDGATAAAIQADSDAARGNWHGPLHGIPIGVKDLFATSRLQTTAGSRLFENNRCDHDAAAVTQLRSAGAIVVGKHVTHEFGFGTDEPPTRGFWDASRYAGGSTVGGAVSLAAGSCLAALGTDGGGSIRKPAAVNGLVGLKPTRDRVTTEGLFPGCVSVDHVGWLTKTVADASLILSVLGGSKTPDLRDGVAGLRLGCPDFFFRGVSPRIAEAVNSALAVLEQQGTSIVRFDLPELERAGAIHGVLVMWEAFQLHRQWVISSPSLYHPRSLAFLKEAANVSASDFKRAEQERIRFIQSMEDVFEEQRIDVICTPTLPISPVPLAEMDPAVMLPKYIRFTAPFNVSGQPAISVPCGTDELGLPVGFQVAARLDQDEITLRIAQVIETAGLWSFNSAHRQRMQR